MKYFIESTPLIDLIPKQSGNTFKSLPSGRTWNTL